MDKTDTPPPRAMRWWMMRLLLFGALLVAAPATLLLLQHSMIYYARRYPEGFEKKLPPGTLQLEFTALAGKQVAFYVPPRTGAPVPEQLWVMFSGNGSLALDWMFLLEAQRNDNAGFLLVDYPGYGRSEGKAGIAKTRETADRALATLAEQLKIEESVLAARISTIGLSLGAAAALEFATGHPVQRVVLIAPFTSLREMAARLFTRPAALLLLENYDNRARLRELAERNPPPRIAIFHGMADSFIPPSMGRELAETFPKFVTFFPVDRATHDTVVGVGMSDILAWMDQR